MAHAQSVEATLQYLAAADAKPVVVPSVGGGDQTRHEAASYEARRVSIRDGRATGPFALDREGFTLARHATEVTDLYDRQQLEAVYNAEIQDIVKAASGAKDVVIFDHTPRAGTPDIQAARGVREPAWFVHNDYTARSAPRRLRDHFPPDEADARLQGRFAIINVWRPIHGPVESAPLAVCDATSVAPKDLIVTERRGKDRVGEIHLATYNPDHRWYYFPLMADDEVLLIKTYDSAVEGDGHATIHVAFEDPTSAPDARPRESVETRTFAFF